MLVSSFNLSQSFNYTLYLFHKKRFKSEINSFCIGTLFVEVNKKLALPFSCVGSDSHPPIAGLLPV
jgi:hypothetical protein